MRLDVQDQVALASGVRWDARARRLDDDVLAVQHPANVSAAVVLDAIAREAQTVDSLVSIVVREFSVDRRQALDDVLQLLLVLDDEALLRVSRPWRLRCRPGELAIVVWGLVFGGDHFLARRHPASVGAVARVTTRILAVPVALLLVGFALLTAALREVRPDLGAAMVVDAGIFVVAAALTLWSTMVAHEVGHLVVLARTRIPSVLVLRGWRMAILYPSGAVDDARAVALVGPLAGVASGIGCASLGLLTSLGPGFALTAAAVGLSHLVHLVPTAADGAVLWRRGSSKEARGAVA